MLRNLPKIVRSMELPGMRRDRVFNTCKIASCGYPAGRFAEQIVRTYEKNVCRGVRFHVLIRNGDTAPWSRFLRLQDYISGLGVYDGLAALAFLGALDDSTATGQQQRDVST